MVLLVTTILAVYKPWGMTGYGRRKQSRAVGPDRLSSTITPWQLYVMPGIIGLVLLFLVLHLIGGRAQPPLSIASNQPAVGAVLMSLSTVVVAINAQLLRRARL